jgi:NAD(P)-dependent dehydrogenase (short-subunit alcohol dehydrogenase family)
MRQEAGAFGVRVLLLQPGTFDTPALARAAEALAAIPAGAERYADLYRNTAARVAQARDTGAMLPAEVVAAAALAAIAAPSPDARCPVGEDAHALITATKTLSDAALDALALGLGDAELEREIRNDQ